MLSVLGFSAIHRQLERASKSFSVTTASSYTQLPSVWRTIISGPFFLYFLNGQEIIGSWPVQKKKKKHTEEKREDFSHQFLPFHPPQTSFNGQINFKWLWGEDQGKKETYLWKKSREEFIGLGRSLWFREIKPRVVDPEKYDWIEFLLLFHIDIK